MLETLLQWDYFLFELINGQWHHRFFDSLLPFWRNKYLWVPLYLFATTFILINYPQKGWRFLIVSALAILLADQLSSGLMKPFFDRPRPCQLPSLAEEIRLLVKCGSGKSFVSSHATNHFALAFCWIVLFGRRFKWIIFPLFLWAASISYGQVYVGVHFPSDVLCGGLLGTVIGSFCGLLGLKWTQEGIKNKK